MDIVEQLKFHSVASCSCCTKSPVTKYHDENCLYRVLVDAADKIEQAQQEASTLAISLHKRYYSDVTQWELCDSVAGIISQIDNMVAGLNEKIKQLEKEITQLKASNKALSDGLRGAIDNLELRCDTTTRGLSSDLKKYYSIVNEHGNKNG